MKHNISCAICGLEKKVEIDDRTHKIIGKGWKYYGKMNVNYNKTDKYFYKVLSWKPEFVTERIINKKYDKNAKPKLVEHWECKECSKE